MVILIQLVILSNGDPTQMVIRPKWWSNPTGDPIQMVIQSIWWSNPTGDIIQLVIQSNWWIKFKW